MFWSPFSHLPINSLRSCDLTAHLCSFKFVVMVSLEGKLNQSLDLELAKRHAFCAELWDNFERHWREGESLPQSRQHLLAPTRYEGVWRKTAFFTCRPRSLFVGASTPAASTDAFVFFWLQNAASFTSHAVLQEASRPPLPGWDCEGI